MHIYYQRRQRTDQEWESRVIATTMELNYDLRDDSNIILSIDAKANITVVHDPGNHYPNNEHLFMAGLLIYGQEISAAAAYVIHQRIQKNPDGY